jgi:hypothetical protein
MSFHLLRTRQTFLAAASLILIVSTPTRGMKTNLAPDDQQQSESDLIGRIDIRLHSMSPEMSIDRAAEVISLLISSPENACLFRINTEKDLTECQFLDADTTLSLALKSAAVTYGTWASGQLTLRELVETGRHLDGRCGCGLHATHRHALGAVVRTPDECMAIVIDCPQIEYDSLSPRVIDMFHLMDTHSSGDCAAYREIDRILKHNWERFRESQRLETIRWRSPLKSSKELEGLPVP